VTAPVRLSERAVEQLNAETDAGARIGVSSFAVVPRNLNADPGDRILVATAEVHGLSIVSADGKIRSMTDRPVVW